MRLFGIKKNMCLLCISVYVCWYTDATKGVKVRGHPERDGSLLPLCGSKEKNLDCWASWQMLSRLGSFGFISIDDIGHTTVHT